MTASSPADPSSPIPWGRESLQIYARVAGVLGVITLIAGGFGEGYVPQVLIVTGNAAATATNILASETLFRWGFAGYLLEAICDATLTMVFWVLVRPVHRNLAMLMVVFRIISTCGFAGAEMLSFGALSTLRSADQLSAFEPAQLQALAFTLIKVSGFGGALFSMFFGLSNLVFGYLLERSRIVPRMFGILVLIMGTVFTLHTFLLVLAPTLATPVLVMASAAIGYFPLIFWLLFKGVNASRYAELQRARA